jgi:hypothetical protein
VVVNSSFYDFRKKFKGYSPNQKFVLFYKQCGSEITGGEYNDTNSFKVEVGEQLLSMTDGGYDFSFTNDGPFLSFDSHNAITYSTEDENKKDYNGYKYVIASIPESYNLTEEDYSHLKV